MSSVSPQVPKSGTTIYGPILDEERGPNISTPEQAFTALRPPSIDQSPDDGDEGYPVVPIPPVALPTMEDSRTNVSIASATVDHSIREAGNEEYHGNPIQTDLEMPLVTPEHPSIDRGDRVVQPGNAPSTSFFQGSSNVQISGSPNFYDVRGNGTFIRFGDGEFTDVQRNLICDYIANLTVLPDINNNLKQHVLTQSIISLPRVKAVFDDYQSKKKSGPCFKGTREALLREMADWATTSSESKMYILSGLAGIGKSTVAYTIASRAADVNLLGASFFFSRDDADRKNAEFFFTTIAYQLCVYSETFAKAIGDVLLTERGSAATTKDPHDQLQALILEPLRSIVQSRSRPIIIVVDALDECDEEEVFSVFTGLSQLVRDLSSFKIILTSRPQPYLNGFLVSRDGHKIFRLQDIEEKIVDGDVRLYLNYKLSLEQIQKRYPKRQWCASDEEIESLVRAVGRLFIIASTAVLYILDKSVSDPAAQMQKLLLASAQDRTPFKDLAHFYTVILRNAVPENCDNGNIARRYQSVVGVIICVQRPLPVSTLAHLTKVNVAEILEVLDNLQSVISLGSDDVPRVYHKSFPDYLTDQARCKDPCLRIDTRIHHTHIVTRCFEIMGEYLKRNILGLGVPARFMSNEDGLKEDGITDEQIQEKVPQQLRYACTYWVNHLEVANMEDEALVNGLERFVRERMLYWLEVLSLIGKLDLAHRVIGVVLKLVTTTPSELHQLLSDALRFISKFYEIIKRSALHTYYSALPFTPTNSLLYRQYIKDAEDSVCTIEGGAEKWGTLVANLTPGQVAQLEVVKFSLDSTLLVSCSEDCVDNYGIHHQGTLKIWDAITGTPISTIPGHRFAVANDISAIASSQDNIATLYNVNGSPSGTMFTTSSKIEALALSSESSRVVAISDIIVWLWDSGNGELIDRSYGCEGYRPRVGFSRTGTRLAYPSAKDIRLQDGISGKFIADLPCKLNNVKFEFSADGSRIASLSFDGGLTLWNSESGELIAAVSNVDQQVDLAISANGSLLATANGFGNKVTSWSDSLALIKVLKVDRPDSMAVSLDNIIAIAAFSDIKLYNINTYSFVQTLPFGNSSFRKPWPRVNLLGRILFSFLRSSRHTVALALSPHCTRLAAGSYDVMNLWDIGGIDVSGLRSKRKAAAVIALTLSRDCSRLVCGFGDGTVELWGTSPTSFTKQRIGPLALRSKMEKFFIRIVGRSRHTDKVTALAFSPDGRLFASGSSDRTIKLWNGGDGVLRETLKAPGPLQAVVLSNSVLVATWTRWYGYVRDTCRDGGVTLWSLDTLSPIHTLTKSDDTAFKVSIAENSTLIAVCLCRSQVTLFDVLNCTTIGTFDVPSDIHTMTFLPDNSQLVVQSDEGVFQSFNLINNNTTEGPTLEHLVQLPNIPLLRPGVPVWHCKEKDQLYLTALFSKHKSPVPVLWIPKQILVTASTQGSSMIALGCEDGRVILLRLPTSHVS